MICNGALSVHLHVKLVVVPGGKLCGLELLQHVGSVREGVLRVIGVLRTPTVMTTKTATTKADTAAENKPTGTY